MLRQKLKKLKKSTQKTYRKYFTYEDSQHSLLSDKAYLKQQFKAKMGYELDLKNPQTFNEKLQWLKLYDRRPEYTDMVDKLAAKKYVADIIGEEHIIPTIAVYNNPDEIDFDALPDQFVLKCTHSSGIGNCICTDKSKLDFEKVREGLRKGLEDDYYLDEREWPYKNVPRKIICEQYMVDESEYELKDYKFFCFDGVPDCVMVSYDRLSDTGAKFYFFDINWELLRYNKRGVSAPEGFTLPKPQNIDVMFKMAEKLAIATKAPFIRVDLYNIRGFIYFGELTFFPDGGYDRNITKSTDHYFGELLDLPN